MTSIESFKRRVRQRMAATGEKYGAARRVLLEQADARDRAAAGDDGDEQGGDRTWVAEPEVGDERLREATGRGWHAWCDLVDAWPGHDGGHTAVARWLVDEHGVDGWWAQTVTVGWERITGRRLPGQRPDGTFVAGRSRTLDVAHDDLRGLLVDDEGRAALFGGLDVPMLSRPGTKSLRLGVEPGVAVVALEPTDDGRTRVFVQHEKLPAHADVAPAQEFWSEWLDALPDALAQA